VPRECASAMAGRQGATLVSCFARLERADLARTPSAVAILT